MNEHPILFSGSMIRAIISGVKTQTRRVIQPQPYYNDAGKLAWKCSGSFPAEEIVKHCPYGTVGSRLWVRETWRPIVDGVTAPPFLYRSDCKDADSYKWRSPIFMPRWASRITLEVTGVRVERLQDISEDDAKAEGVGALDVAVQAQFADNRSVFAYLWNSINGKKPGRAWKDDPWVWRIEFKLLNNGEC